MAKARLIRTMVAEYDLTPAFYPGCNTLEEMVQQDAALTGRMSIWEGVPEYIQSDRVSWALLEDDGTPMDPPARELQLTELARFARLRGWEDLAAELEKKI